VPRRSWSLVLRTSLAREISLSADRPKATRLGVQLNTAASGIFSSHQTSPEFIDCRRTELAFDARERKFPRWIEKSDHVYQDDRLMEQFCDMR
jgi:hypothetical protein